MRLAALLLLPLAFVACDSHRRDAGCVQAGEAVARDVVFDRQAMVAARITGHCRDDGWSEDVIACVITSTSPGLSACEAKLTDEQRAKMHDEAWRRVSGQRPIE